MSEDREKKSVLEAILFLSGEVISPPSLKDILELPESEIKRLTGELIWEYRRDNQES